MDVEWLMLDYKPRGHYNSSRISKYSIFNTLGLLRTTLFLSLLTSLIYPDLAFIIYAVYVQSDALFPCLYFRPWSIPLSVPLLTIATLFSLAHQNPAWLHYNLFLMWLHVWLPAFLDSLISLLSWQKSSNGFIFLHGFSLRFSSLFIKPIWAWLLAIFCKLILHFLSAISGCSLDRNDLVSRSRTSTSQQCTFASAGPLLWNCLPAKICAQILSGLFSSTPCLLKFFFSLWRIALGKGTSDYSLLRVAPYINMWIE